MTNQEILEKAIQKAIDGGWKGSPYLDYTKISNDQYLTNLIMGENVWLVTIVYCPPHDFAKALWGEARDVEKYAYYLEGELFDYKTPEEFKKIEQAGEDDNSWERYGPIYKNKGWQYHLQQMVIAEDPIKYLGDHLDD